MASQDLARELYSGSKPILTESMTPFFVTRRSRQLLGRSCSVDGSAQTTWSGVTSCILNLTWRQRVSKPRQTVCLAILRPPVASPMRCSASSWAGTASYHRARCRHAHHKRVGRFMLLVSRVPLSQCGIFWNDIPSHYKEIS